jgi:hypothetical protein
MDSTKRAPDLSLSALEIAHGQRQEEALRAGPAASRPLWSPSVAEEAIHSNASTRAPKPSVWVEKNAGPVLGHSKHSRRK